LQGATGDWKVLGVFNWRDRPASRRIDLGALNLDPTCSYHVADFWRRCYRRVTDGTLWLPDIPAHGGHLLAIRKLAPGPQFVGSSLHFSQGAEVRGWQVEDQAVTLRIDLGRVASGHLWLALPGEPDLPGARSEAVGPGIWQIGVDVQGATELRIPWR
jgi:hypothetical protein